MKPFELSNNLNNEAMNLTGFGMIYCEDIFNLDLSAIKLKLKNRFKEQAWSKNKCDAVELGYKRILTLKRMFRNKVLIPSPAINQFWEQHYQDKAKYAADCQVVFGYFMGKYTWNQKYAYQEFKELRRAYAETCRLYQHYFGGKYS